MKKVWNIASKILLWLVILVTVLVMLFTIFASRTVGRQDRDIFGYRAYIVLSNSMSKTDFDAGDLVFSEKVDPTTLKEGDVISFISENSHNKGQVVTHKIRSKTVDKYGNPAFTTYGTTTNTDDEAPVSYPFILGKYSFRIPKLGSFFNFLRTVPGYLLFIFLPFALLIGWQGVNCVKLFRRYKQEQLDQIDQEKEELKAERQKSEEMLEEIKRLKAQLQAQNGETPEEEPKQESVTDDLDLDNILQEFSEKEDSDA